MKVYTATGLFHYIFVSIFSYENDYFWGSGSVVNEEKGLLNKPAAPVPRREH